EKRRASAHRVAFGGGEEFRDQRERDSAVDHRHAAKPRRDSERRSREMGAARSDRRRDSVSRVRCRPRHPRPPHLCLLTQLISNHTTEELTPLLAAAFTALTAHDDHAVDHKMLVNRSAAGLAIEGYDPVAYCTDGKPVKGDAKFSAKHEIASY